MPHVAHSLQLLEDHGLSGEVVEASLGGASLGEEVDLREIDESKPDVVIAHTCAGPGRICGAPAGYVCGKCRLVYFCSKQCLHGAWDAGHKEDCLGIVTHRAARVASTAAGLKSVAGASSADSTVDGARDVTQAASGLPAV